MSRPLLLLLFLVTTASHADDGMELGLIPLHYRTAEELIPLVRPFLDPQGAISGEGARLILRTTPANLHEVRQVVRELDRRPRQLRITVRQGIGLELDASGNELHGGIVSGAGRVIVSGGGAREGGRAELERGAVQGGGRHWSTRRRDDGADTQQLLTLEGQPALIRVGKSFPVVSEYQNGPQGQSATIEYHDADTGFTVLPRLSGNEVTLEIQPRRDVLSPGGAGVVDTQALHTVVRGRLGEWLELGGALRERSGNQGGIAYSTRDRSEQRRRVWVKVEEER